MKSGTDFKWNLPMEEEALRRFIEKFETFDHNEINAIIENTHVESFSKGTVIQKEGEVCTRCYFILSGCVRQYQIVNGEEKTTAFFTEGQASVLYSSYIEARPSEYYLSCVENCTLIVGTREQEKKLHQQHPGLAHLINTLMPQDYDRIQNHLSSMISNSPEERYLNLIATQPHLLDRVPLNQIASYIGVTPESFSRIRKRILLKAKSQR
jgi:CRP-like cAMP-binding protein